MKKFWEKHDLLKIAGIFVIFTVILTWLVPQGMFQMGELQAEEIVRVGLFDFFTYGLLGVYYFTVLVTFLFVLGGFYQVLSRTGGYQKLTDSIAKKFKGMEIFFVLVISFVIAALTSIINEYYIVIVFIPFIVTILSKMKLDKITSFVTTFGSILVGIIGTVYTDKIVSFSVRQMGVEYDTYIWVKLILFASAFILMSLFVVLNMRKQAKAKKAVAMEDMFATKDTTKRKAVWPLAVILGLFSIIAIMAYLPWEQVFQVTFFSELTDTIMKANILGQPVWSYILGNVEAFGRWDIFGIQILMLITAIIIKFVYGIKFDEFFTSFGEGFRKASKLVIVMLVALLILEFAVMYPVLPTIFDWIVGLTKSFNVILVTLASLFTSFFTAEYQYTVSLVGEYLTTNFEAVSAQLAIMLQATYGLASFFVPSSVVLLVGLSYLDITYKDWMKYIWKFLIAMLLIIVVIMLIIS